MKFSRHGPIFYEDAAHHRAYALRSSLMEQGTAEYIGGLRMDQATSARDCLTNADFMRSPPTNLVCASADGAIAFRVSAAAPKRRGWDGRLPVPGHRRVRLGRAAGRPAAGAESAARMDRDGEQQHPPAGLQESALLQRPRARIGAISASRRLLDEGKTSGKKFTVDDLRAMLRDSYKTEADELKPWFQGWTASTPDVERARSVVAELGQP